MGIIGEDHVALKRHVAELEAKLAEAEELNRDRQEEFMRGEWVSTSGYREQVARAEQAERERDEARGVVEQADTERAFAQIQAKHNLARAERAEADNAALLAMLDNAETIHATGCDGMPCECGALAVREADHPGAALLERLRAAEAMRRLASHDEACQLDISGAKDTTNCAVCEFDALEKGACDECGMVGTHKLQCGRRG